MNIRKIGCCLSSLALIAGLIACGNDISETNPSTPAGRPSQISVQTPSDPQLAAFSGKVVEKQDVSPYTYVRLDDGAGNQIWAAVPQTQLEIGEEIALKGGSVMTNFTSKTLNRTFESIIFASGLVRGSDNKTARMPGGANGSSSGAVHIRDRPSRHDLTIIRRQHPRNCVFHRRSKLKNQPLRTATRLVNFLLKLST